MPPRPSDRRAGEGSSGEGQPSRFRRFFSGTRDGQSRFPGRPRPSYDDGAPGPSTRPGRRPEHVMSAENPSLGSLEGVLGMSGGEGDPGFESGRRPPRQAPPIAPARLPPPRPPPPSISIFASDPRRESQGGHVGDPAPLYSPSPSYHSGPPPSYRSDRPVSNARTPARIPSSDYSIDSGAIPPASSTYSGPRRSSYSVADYSASSRSSRIPSSGYNAQPRYSGHARPSSHANLDPSQAGYAADNAYAPSSTSRPDSAAFPGRTSYNSGLSSASAAPPSRSSYSQRYPSQGQAGSYSSGYGQPTPRPQHPPGRRYPSSHRQGMMYPPPGPQDYPDEPGPGGSDWV